MIKEPVDGYVARMKDLADALRDQAEYWDADAAETLRRVAREYERLAETLTREESSSRRRPRRDAS